MELTIVIPAYNEGASLHDPDFGRALTWLRGSFSRSEVILVDDGSTDDTVHLARHQVDEVLSQEHRGKAAALEAGFAMAQGEHVFWTDADWSVPVRQIVELNNALSRGSDYVFASRGWNRPGAPFHRWLGSCIFTAVIRHTFGWTFQDTQCGMKGAKREALIRIAPELIHFKPGRPDRHAGTDAMYDIECLLVCRKLGLRVRECPAEWMHYKNRAAQQYRPLLKQIYRDYRQIRRHYLAGRYDSMDGSR